MGGGNDTDDDPVEPTASSDSTENTDSDVAVSADFLMTVDAFNITEVGDGSRTIAIRLEEV